MQFQALLRFGFLALLAAQPSAAQVERAQNTISVNGTAEIRVVPDEVILNLGIETNDMSLTTAKQANDVRVRKVIAVAKAAGVEDRRLQTDFLDVEPRYETVNNVRTFRGYWVRRAVAITLRDISKFDALLSDALEGGANYVHGIEFRTTEFRKHRDEARARAIRAAQEKAAALVKELGLSLGKAQSIEEYPVGWWSSYGYYARGWGNRMEAQAVQNSIQEAGAAAPEEGTLAPGQILVSAQVRVVFTIQNR